MIQDVASFTGKIAAWVAVAVVIGAGIPRAAADEGDESVVERVAATYHGPILPAGSPRACDAVEMLVGFCATIDNRAGQPLLPPGTSVDACEWSEHILTIHLTIGGKRPADWRLSPLDLESITAILQWPFQDDPAFAGTRIRARGSAAEAFYRSLDAFIPELRATALTEFSMGAGRGESAAGQSGAPVAAPPPHPPAPRGGPVGNADRQPSGALSGVTVYVAGGHGWTAGATDWLLQRTVGLGMVEDYGNLDVINLFAAYAFNAGATVVPLRPIGWQPIEVVLDNDDPGVTYTGDWSDSSDSVYYENGVTNSGIPYRFASAAATQTETARYAPAISVTGYYPVYCFTVGGANRVEQTYRIGHDGGTTEVIIDHRNVGSGWVWLGNYYCIAGGANYVEIPNSSPDAGVIIADAIRWGGGYGDVSRPGPGAPSGYPRDQEAQRYWVESQWGNNAVGFASSLWDLPSADDVSDNVGAGARVAAEMNRVPPGGIGVERWKRIYLEMHTNASNGSARGQLCLITDLGATTNQTAYATTLSNEIDADMNLLSSQGEFEHPWVDRSSPTLTGSYGAIATTNNDNEFDATLVELAFHDNEDDAELLRDPRVRSYMARACVHGMIRFLNSLSAGQVPLQFPPDTPREFAVRDGGGGTVLLSWTAPLADNARGGAATGYVIYQSSDGLGFGNPIIVGNVTSTSVVGVPVDETRYFRIAATNAGGESMPSEVLAVRRPESGTAGVLIVNGFDRLRRQQNPLQTFVQPPAYAGLSIERQMWRASNSFDFVIEHADALAATGLGFSSCANEAAASGGVPLGNYPIVDWLLGVESVDDLTFSTAEQTAVTNYLNAGGRLFVSGSDLGFDLILAGHGIVFAQNTLRVGYALNNAGTTSIAAPAAGAFAGLAALTFTPPRGSDADALTTRPESTACLMYANGGVAGVQYSSGTYNVISLGFPFEAIDGAATRAQVMQRAVAWLQTASGPLPFDFDNDGDVDFTDFQVMLFCWQGPGSTYPPGQVCLEFDNDGDRDVDLADFWRMQQAFTGP